MFIKMTEEEGHNIFLSINNFSAVEITATVIET